MGERYTPENASTWKAPDTSSPDSEATAQTRQEDDKNENLVIIEEISREVEISEGLKELGLAIELQAKFQTTLEKMKYILLHSDDENLKAETKRDLGHLQEYIFNFSSPERMQKRNQEWSQKIEENKRKGRPEPKYKLGTDFDKNQVILMMKHYQ